MKLITRQVLADEAPERFKNVYSLRKHSHWTSTIEALLALPKPVDADEVDRLIGNKSWTTVSKCHECGTEGHAAVIEVGEEPDYESYTAYLCLSCAQQAAAAFGSLS